MIFRIVYRPEGKHVSCGLFVASARDRTFALCGHFLVRAGEEFEALKAEFEKAEFVEAPETAGESLRRQYDRC